MVAPLGRRSGRKRSQVRKICSWMWTWKIVVVAMLGNTRRSEVVTSKSPWRNKRRSGVVTSISPWTYHQFFTVRTRWKSHLRSQKETCKYQERGWLTLWVSRPKQSFKNTKRQGMPSEMSARRTFLRLLGSLRKLRNYLMRQRGPNLSLLRVTFI